MKICAVQLNLKQCLSYNSFLNYLEKEVFQNLPKDVDLVCFPENINLCLLFAKKQNIQKLGIKTNIEILFDKIISSLDLSFLLRIFNIENQKQIIIDACSFLADKYQVTICTGSYYHKKNGQVYNSVSLVDQNGVIDEFSKYKLTGFERALKLGYQDYPKVIDDLGICICYDLNDKDFIAEMKNEGAKIILAPSNGWRPFPNYPFDKIKERPQVQRAIENKVNIVRPYCSGWLFPFFYFQGHSHIVNYNGITIVESKTRNKTELLFADFSLMV
jgi:predicted amidohydrolase